MTDPSMPEQVEYKGHVITITLIRQEGGAWLGAFSIDGSPPVQAMPSPSYFKQTAFDEALSAARLQINSELI
jgi:hypothetical protein